MALDDFFEQNVSTGGGPGHPSPKFDKVGDKIAGYIVGSVREGVVTIKDTPDPKLDKNGNTMPQLAITLQTDLRNWDNANRPGRDEDGNDLPPSEDTGLRTIYVKYSSQITKLNEAIRKANSTKKISELLVEGAKVGMQFVGETKVGGGRLKEYGFAFKESPNAPKAVDSMFDDAEASKPAEKPAPTSAPAVDEDPDF